MSVTMTLPQDQDPLVGNHDDEVLEALDTYLTRLGDARAKVAELEARQAAEIAAGVAQQVGGDPDCLDCGGKGWVPATLVDEEKRIHKHGCGCEPCPTCRGVE